MNRPLALITGIGPGTGAADARDVTDEAQLDVAISAVKAEFGAPSLPIHNAVGGVFGNFLKIDPQVLNGNF